MLANEAAEAVRARDRSHVWHTWSPIRADRARLMFVDGDGSRLTDIDGRVFLDASSLGSTAGFAHPRLAAAIAEQAAALHSVDISVASHELAGQLAARLSAAAGADFHQTLFVNSGSEAMEAAVMIATEHANLTSSGRRGIVTFRLGYHGSTLLARSLSGLPRVGHPFASPLPVTHVDLPATGCELRTDEACSALVARFADAIYAQPGEVPIAVVIEPFINVGGAVVLPEGLLVQLRALCDSAGILLILDEVFTGIGRAGRMFAFQREHMVPDILVSSKGLAGGYVPIAAATVRDQIFEVFDQEPVIGGLRYGHTTSGHAIGCATALATLDLVEEFGLPAKAESLGQRFQARFEHRVGSGGVRDVRHLGLILVVEMVSDAEAEALARQIEEQGLLVRLVGAALMLVPPLSVEEEDVDLMFDCLDRALDRPPVMDGSA